jgi:radical SAM protein with 4Fe4S-binding SPASM domain
MNPKLKLLFREGTQYLEQFFAQRTLYVPRPIEAALFLTKRCNSRCSMCNFWKNPDKNKEISTEQVLGLLDAFSKMGVVVLSLSAEGEITLRKDLPEILEKAYHNNFLYSVNSNFLNISQEVLKVFAKYKPYQVTVGIDTINPERYTLIRGIENGVTMVSSNIKKLQQTGFSNIVLGTVILYDNLEDCIDLAKYVTDHKLKGIRFTAFQPFGFGKKWSHEELDRYTNEEYQVKLRKVISILIKMKMNGVPIINSIPYLKSIPDSFINPLFFPVPCRIPYRRIHVYSNGDISLCQVMERDAIVGNIDNSSLDYAWYSKHSRQIRNIVEKKRCGGCWLSCYAETNLRFSKKYFNSSFFSYLKRYKGL